MSRRVLVADDSSTIQKVIKIAFSRHELDILEAASLIEALATVARSPVDALIIDASLPGARGPDDLARLRGDAGDVPVLVLIGTYDVVDEEAFRRAGFAQFLKKPFESQDIVSAIDGMLGAGPAVGAAGGPELTPPPPLGRPQHPTMFMTGGAFDPARGGDTAPTASPGPAGSASPGAVSFRLADDDLGTDPEAAPPPPPVTDQTRRGRRAFSEREDTGSSRAGGGTQEATDPRRSPTGRAAPTPLPPIPPGAGMGSGLSLALDPAAIPLGKGQAPVTYREPHRDDDREHGREGDIEADVADLAAIVDDRLPALVRQAVEDYCERHFKSLAREIIAGELRRLADEKARHLVDN